MKKFFAACVLTLFFSLPCWGQQESDYSFYYGIAYRYSAYIAGSVIAAKAPPGVLAGAAIALMGETFADATIDSSDEPYSLFTSLGIAAGLFITFEGYSRTSRLVTPGARPGIILFPEVSIKAAVLTGIVIRMVIDAMGIIDSELAYNKAKEILEKFNKKVSLETEAQE